MKMYQILSKRKFTSESIETSSRLARILLSSKDGKKILNAIKDSKRGRNKKVFLTDDKIIDKLNRDI